MSSQINPIVQVFPKGCSNSVLLYYHDVCHVDATDNYVSKPFCSLFDALVCLEVCYGKFIAASTLSYSIMPPPSLV